MDKAESFTSAGGPLGSEVKAAMYGKTDGVKAVNYVYGIGGRDVKVEDIQFVYNKLMEFDKAGQVPESYQYLGIRE